MTKDLGLRESDLLFIGKALDQVAGLRKAVVFGSRAKGSHRPGSDVDLALFGDSVSTDDLIRLSESLNELAPLPYRFDVVQYETITSADLRQHIDRVGECIWRNGILTP